MHPVLTRRLGARRSKPQPYAPRVAAYLAAAQADAGDQPLAAYPPVDWTEGIQWDALGNTDAGNCVEAALCHLAQGRAAANGQPITPTSTEAKAFYKAVEPGWVPGNEATDTGSDPVSAMQMLMNPGVVIGGKLHKIAGFASIDPKSLHEMQYAINYGGGVLSVVALPIGNEHDQSYSVGQLGWPAAPLGGEWAPGSWGLHAIATMAQSPAGFKAISWGMPLWMDEDWLMKAYGVEHWMVLWEDIELPGVNAERLAADMARLANGLA